MEGKALAEQRWYPACLENHGGSMVLCSGFHHWHWCRLISSIQNSPCSPSTNQLLDAGFKHASSGFLHSLDQKSPDLFLLWDPFYIPKHTHKKIWHCSLSWHWGHLLILLIYPLFYNIPTLLSLALNDSKESYSPKANLLSASKETFWDISSG